MYPLGTWFVSGICVWIPYIKETIMMMMMMMMMMIIIIIIVITTTTFFFLLPLHLLQLYKYKTAWFHSIP